MHPTSRRPALPPFPAALIAGLAHLGEILSAGHWLAVALVVAASAGSTVTSRRAAGAAAPEAHEGWSGA